MKSDQSSILGGPSIREWFGKFRPTVVTCGNDALDAVKAERERLGLSQDEVDHRAGLTRGHVGKIEGGDKPWGKTAFHMTRSFTWVLEALGLRLVIVKTEEAERLAGERITAWRERTYQPRAGDPPPQLDTLRLAFSTAKPKKSRWLVSNFSLTSLTRPRSLSGKAQPSSAEQLRSAAKLLDEADETENPARAAEMRQEAHKMAKSENLTSPEFFIAYCLSKMSLREASESWVRIASALYALGAPVGLSEVIHVNEPDFEAAEAEKRKQAARSKGGHATAKKLSPERRSEIATKAAQKRWANRCRKTKNSSK